MKKENVIFTNMYLIIPAELYRNALIEHEQFLNEDGSYKTFAQFRPNARISLDGTTACVTVSMKGRDFKAIEKIADDTGLIFDDGGDIELLSLNEADVLMNTSAWKHEELT